MLILRFENKDINYLFFNLKEELPEKFRKYFLQEELNVSLYLYINRLLYII